MYKLICVLNKTHITIPLHNLIFLQKKTSGIEQI